MMSISEQPRRDDWKAPLRARFPIAKSAGIECFKGWQPILARMLERLEAAVAQQPAAVGGGLEVKGIREKFGVLRRIYRRSPARSAGDPRRSSRGRDGHMRSVRRTRSNGRSARRGRWLSSGLQILPVVVAGVDPGEQRIGVERIADLPQLGAEAARPRIGASAKAATAARRLVSIRRSVLAGTKQRMQIDFGTTSAELTSLWHAFGDEIRISISSLLSPGNSA